MGAGLLLAAGGGEVRALGGAILAVIDAITTKAKPRLITSGAS